MQKEIRLQEFQFFRQRYQCFILTLQNITVYTGQMLGEMNSITRVIFSFSNQCIETIKQKMGIQLEEGYLVVSNPIQPKKSHESPGVGLKNLSNRCQLMLGKEIIVHNDEKVFIVKVPLLYE